MVTLAAMAHVRMAQNYPTYKLDGAPLPILAVFVLLLYVSDKHYGSIFRKQITPHSFGCCWVLNA